MSASSSMAEPILPPYTQCAHYNYDITTSSWVNFVSGWTLATLTCSLWSWQNWLLSQSNWLLSELLQHWLHQLHLLYLVIPSWFDNVYVPAKRHRTPPPRGGVQVAQACRLLASAALTWGNNLLNPKDNNMKLNVMVLSWCPKMPCWLILNPIILFFHAFFKWLLSIFMLPFTWNTMMQLSFITSWHYPMNYAHDDFMARFLVLPY